MHPAHSSQKSFMYSYNAYANCLPGGMILSSRLLKANGSTTRERINDIQMTTDSDVAILRIVHTPTKQIICGNFARSSDLSEQAHWSYQSMTISPEYQKHAAATESYLASRLIQLYQTVLSCLSIDPTLSYSMAQDFSGYNLGVYQRQRLVWSANLFHCARYC